MDHDHQNARITKFAKDHQYIADSMQNDPDLHALWMNGVAAVADSWQAERSATDTVSDETADASSKVVPGPIKAIAASTVHLLFETPEAFAWERAQASAMSVAQALKIGDLEYAGPLPVRWRHHSLPREEGVVLKLTAAIPDAPPPEGSDGYPVIVFPNAFSLTVFMFSFKQHEWATKGFIGVSYLSRGWYEAGGYPDMGGPLDMDDASAVIDMVEAHASEWGADPSALAFAGLSYSAGLAVLAAAHDARIKAVASLCGWGNLTNVVDPQGAPNRFYIEGIKLLADIGASRLPAEQIELLDISIHHARSREDWNRDAPRLMSYVDQRSIERFPKKLCRRGTPVFLALNADDGLLTSDAGLQTRQFLHGAGCRVFTMVDEGEHAFSAFPNLMIPSTMLTAFPVNEWLIKGMGYRQPLWQRTFDFFDTFLRGAHGRFEEEAPIQFQLRSSKTGVGMYFAEPTYLGFEEWPPRRSVVTPTAFAMTDSGGLIGSVEGVAHRQRAPGLCDTSIAFGTASGINPGVPILGTVLKTTGGVQSRTFLDKVNRTAAAIYRTPPLERGATICGLPNASLSVLPSRAGRPPHSPGDPPESLPRFQVHTVLFDIEEDGNSAKLLTSGVRNVWMPGVAGLNGGWAGPGTKLTVGMHALCVEVPAGHAIGLGVDLFNVYYTPASTDPALRLGLSCDARSRLALPVVNSGDGAPQTHTLL